MTAYRLIFATTLAVLATAAMPDTCRAQAVTMNGGTKTVLQGPTKKYYIYASGNLTAPASIYTRYEIVIDFVDQMGRTPPQNAGVTVGESLTNDPNAPLNQAWTSADVEVPKPAGLADTYKAKMTACRLIGGPNGIVNVTLPADVTINVIP